jgi:thioredoxin 1
MKKYKLLVILIIIILIATFVGCKKEENTNTQTNKVNKEQESQITDNDNYKITFIELGSVNCIPCKAMQPIMKEIEEEYKGIVKVVFHDVWTDKGRKDAEPYNIRVIPTQVFLDENGVEFFRHEGFFAKEKIVELIEGVN